MSKIKLYLIPGTMCNEQLWSRVLPYLASDIALTHLPIPANKTFDELACFYNELFEDKSVNLVGFSLGGYIASYFAVTYPSRVNKLFVISNSATRLPAHELKLRDQVLSLVKRYGYKGMSVKKIMSMLDNQNQTEQLVDIIAEMDRSLGEREMISQYQYTSDRDELGERLAQLTIPCHFHYSEHDMLVNVDWFNDIKRRNENISVTASAGSGHMLPLEKPEELAHLLNEWLLS